MIAVAAIFSCELPVRTTGTGSTIAQLVVTPKTVTLQPNQVQDFMAIGFTAAGDTAQIAVTWRATAGTVETSSAGGRHYGHYHHASCGQFGLRATSQPGGLSDSATITVSCPPTPVASVSVGPASPNILMGQTIQLTATLRDANGNVLTGRTVTWSSNNAAASVNGTGLVTGAAAGSAAITATSEGQSGTASVTVSNVPVASVTVSPTSASLLVGQTVQLTATPKDANGNPLIGRTVTWSSSNASIASVSASGLLSGATAGGPVTITATSEGQSGTASVTVANAPIASVTVAPASASLLLGQTVQLTATPKDANGNPLTGRVVSWSSNNTSVATVDGSGLVTAGAVGSATIAAMSEGRSGTATITVTGVPVASVTVSPAAASVQAGQTQQLTATLKDASGNVLTGRTVTWSSGNTTVASVNGTGLVTAKVAGSATITATSEGQSGTAAITVTPVPVASVTVAPGTGSVAVGSTLQLAATPRDANGNPLTGRTITWQSSNATVASVNGSGLVTGVAVGGPVTITATSEGQSGTSAITVTPPSASVVLVGAGDIADCDAQPTAALLDNIPGTVFTAGDNAYPDGTAADYASCYDPSWGRHKARTRPAPGNHDYNTSGATGYYAYFGALAGPAGRGYYSYDLGAWHIVSLNSNVSMSAGSAQETWLRADLAASTKTCTIAYWHHPRFSSGSNHGSSTQSAGVWQALYDAGAEIVISGHDHEYERFAPQTPSAAADPARGIREFIVGTGGAGLYSFATPLPNSEVRDDTSFGVLKLTLSNGSYTWEFIPIAGDSFTDSGSGTCH
jgi:uncharacterized protein YjdB